MQAQDNAKDGEFIVFKRHLFTSAVALAAFTGLTGQATAASASGNSSTDVSTKAVQTFKNKQTGRCLDDSNSGGLRTVACNGSDYQNWDVTREGHIRTFKNVRTGRCLDDSPAGLRSVACNSTVHQGWLVENHGDRGLLFTSEWSQNVLDDSNSKGLRTAPSNGTAYQHWA